MPCRVVRFPASQAGLAGIVRIREMLASRQGDAMRSVAERRKEAVAVSRAVAAKLPVRIESIGGVAVERHDGPSLGGSGLLLFAHGGAYVTGSPMTHRSMAAQIAAAAALPLLSVDYRLAPEWPFPAGRDDVVAVYAALVGAGETAIGLIGDSAGGGVMMQAALAIRDAGLPPPAAIAVLSPWVDLACRGTSHETRRDADRMLSMQGLLLDAGRYVGGLSATDPSLSVIDADLEGLPPLLIQTGEQEVLADDALLLAQTLEKAGVPVELQIWEGMTHVWYGFRGILPEADQAMQQLGAFLRARMASES